MQARDELVDYVCKKEMGVYSQIFTPVGDTAQLDRVGTLKLSSFLMLHYPVWSNTLPSFSMQQNRCALHGAAHTADVSFSSYLCQPKKQTRVVQTRSSLCLFDGTPWWCEACHPWSRVWIASHHSLASSRRQRFPCTHIPPGELHASKGQHLILKTQHPVSPYIRTCKASTLFQCCVVELPWANMRLAHAAER